MFQILDGKLHNDETLSPGYVWFRCADYAGLPDNTGRGYHVVYRPLARGMYTGHEHLTDAMLADVRSLYDQEKAAGEDRERVRREQFSTAGAVLAAIPKAAIDELNAVNRGLRQHFAGVNEGGEGFVLQHDWRSKTGIEILNRHGVDAAAVAEAEEYLSRDNII